MNRPLGCLTGSALVAAVLAGVVIASAAAMTGNEIFNPGPLNAEAGTAALDGVRSHAELRGDCGRCHPAFWSKDRMGDRCLACHSEVADEMRTADGFHAGFATAANCRNCHSDHNGTQAMLTRADMRGFPHDRTGFSLRAHPPLGEGGTYRCQECHPTSLRQASLSTCVECHVRLDAPRMVQHRANFGDGCLGCHDGLDSYGRNFDHAKTVFPLLGRHAGLECVYCHRGATSIRDLQSAPTECRGCHAPDDIHQGRLGEACGDCHNPSGWGGATLDHGLTRFPLTGKHLGVTCESCHVDGRWVGINTACRSCHERDDAHGGQFSVDCVDCHTTTGWANVTFSHARTTFPLEASHASTECAACHAGGRYVGTPNTCYGCHAADDRHNGQFGTDCSACHRPTTWADWTFNHDLSAFPLTGAHRSLDCAACHRGGRFAGTPTACAACHSRPASHGSAFGGSCGSCHSTSAWRPAKFNGPHPFPMNHGGAGGRCGRCHPSSLMDYTCYGCHDRGEMQNKHREVTSNLGNCARCHPTGRGEGGD